MKKVLFSLALVSLLAACSSVPLDEPVKTEVPVVDKGTSSVVEAQPISAEVRPIVVEPTVDVNGFPLELSDKSSPLFQRSIYFDFDEYTVKPEYANLIAAHTEFTKEHPELSVHLEGNSDSRGSHEYNLALGQRRSEAVEKAMRLLGVSSDAVEAISYGEEKPVDESDNESAWAKNRRVDIIYKNSKGKLDR